MTFQSVLPVSDIGSETKQQDRRLIAAVVAISSVYATLRYNVFKGVPWSDWPHFICNKVLAISALVLIAIAVRRLAARRPGPIRRLMATASGFALVHTFVSLALCRPEYFDKFFAGPKFSLSGGTSMLLASAAMALLLWGKGRPGSVQPSVAATALAIVAMLSGLHAGVPSMSTWFAPRTWPGFMPPITLVSFVVGLFAFGTALARHRRGVKCVS